MSKKKKKHDVQVEEQHHSGSKLQDLRLFWEQSQAEIKKVAWPDRKETLTTSAAVILLVLIMSLFLGGVDLGLGKLIESVLS
jgi:preprotein translocase subunit SecE